jgi:hypothetical protein
VATGSSLAGRLASATIAVVATVMMRGVPSVARSTQRQRSGPRSNEPTMGECQPRIADQDVRDALCVGCSELWNAGVTQDAVWPPRRTLTTVGGGEQAINLSA